MNLDLSANAKTNIIIIQYLYQRGKIDMLNKKEVVLPTNGYEVVTILNVSRLRISI